MENIIVNHRDDIASVNLVIQTFDVFAVHILLLSRPPASNHDLGDLAGGVTLTQIYD